MASIMRQPGMSSVGYVYIVDDDAQQRSLLREVFQSEGYQVAEAANGQIALTHLRQSQERMIVLLDQMMPVLDGIGVLRAVAADPHLAAQHAYLLISAKWRRPPEIEALLARLSVPVITKPYDLEMLLERVAEAAQRLEQGSVTSIG